MSRYEDEAYHVGFTGTRTIPKSRLAKVTRGITRALSDIVTDESDVILHHGDCIGADELAHGIALGLEIRVILHPPKDPKQRAWCKGAWKKRKLKPYLERNRDIVDESDILLAVPKDPNNEPSANRARNQGTWYTIRYARKRGVPVVII